MFHVEHWRRLLFLGIVEVDVSRETFVMRKELTGTSWLLLKKY